ncbi:hypothetical protein [Pseudomonas phage KP1]|uniref:Uncharacterized protein n=1 Tax=Pseudomonas phage KP1 TaxID=2562463 RepID=A0A6G5QAH7_9CAUD|nr:hypothetical protein PM391_gp28 [Pseudomonas phage KP1]QBZ71738.1 hypothetical protein [Pseudomonas phage KP1]
MKGVLMSEPINALPIPQQCDACCSLNIKFLLNEPVSANVYFCDGCGASAGCHRGTNKPLGQMGDRATRQLRKKAHDEFDKLWRSGLMRRSKAYNWLALQLGIEPDNCHMSQLSKDQLKDVITLSADYLTNNHAALARRKAKQDAKQEKRNKRNAAAERRTSNDARQRTRKR